MCPLCHTNVSCKHFPGSSKRVKQLVSYSQSKAICWAVKSYRFKALRLTFEERIEELRNFARMKISSRRWGKKMRESFNRKKSSHWNDSIYCHACGELADHLHHIIQIQNGGRNTPYLIVPLCRCCHRLIHPWLKA